MGGKFRFEDKSADDLGKIKNTILCFSIVKNNIYHKFDTNSGAQGSQGSGGTLHKLCTQIKRKNRNSKVTLLPFFWDNGDR